MKYDLSIKHIITSLLAVIVSLLLVLGSFTLVQADTVLSDFPSLGVDYTSLKSNAVFSRVALSDLNNSTDPVKIFNNFYMKDYDGSGLYQIGLLLSDGSYVWSSATVSSASYSYVYFVLTAGRYIQLQRSTSDSSQTFGSLPSGSFTGFKFGSDYPTDETLVPVVSLGDSIAIADSVGNPLSYTFDNGYLMVIDLGNTGASYEFDLSSTSESYSTWLSGSFPDTNQSYWFTSTLPSVDDVIPDSNASLISWSRGANRNIFGQTYSMVASLSGTSSGRYLCIYNPPVHTKWTSGSNPTSSEVVNYPVTVSGLSDQAFWIFNSTARLAYAGTAEVLIDATIVDDTGIGIISGGAITVVDSNGDQYTQISGGATDISGANGGTIQNNIRGLQQTLDNFVTQFTSLLSAPISHIQQLISSGGSFMQALSQMFTWLPAPVQGVITSGLVVLVAIGVLKLLL